MMEKASWIGGVLGVLSLGAGVVLNAYKQYSTASLICLGIGAVLSFDVLPGPGVALDPERLETSRRGTLTTAACGVCGRVTVDDLLERVGPLAIDDGLHQESGCL